MINSNILNSENAIRYCTVTAGNDGKWETPNVDGCISPVLYHIKKKVGCISPVLYHIKEKVGCISPVLYHIKEKVGSITLTHDAIKRKNLPIFVK